MRPGVVFNFVNEEWFDHRRIIIGYFIISLFLDGMMIVWGREALLTWFKTSHVEDINATLSAFSFVILILPYAVIWVTIISRLGREARSGLYTFLQTFPMTVKEIVTAKFASAFVLHGCATAWMYGLWWWYTVSFSYSPDFQYWTALYVIAFFIPLWFALHHGLFFRSGAKGADIVVLIWIPLIFLGRSHIADTFVNRLGQMIEEFTLISATVGVLAVVLVWFICWCWAMTTYRKNLQGT